MTKRERKALVAFAKFLRAPGTSASDLAEEGWCILSDTGLQCEAYPCRCADIAESMAREWT